MIQASVGRALHVGPGGHALPSWLKSYEETQLDINPNCSPDICASITDMGAIGEFELVYCAHCLEHLFPWEVEMALKECLRVLQLGGALVLLVPDLEGVKPTNEVLYTAECGNVTGLDMYYGHAESIKLNPHMQHKTGFVRETLIQALTKAGFSNVIANRVPEYNLLGGGNKA